MVPHEHHGSGIIGGCSIVLLLEVAQEVLLALQDDMARWVARGTWEATTPECDDDTCLTGSYAEPASCQRHNKDFSGSPV